ncbi:MAG: hypothetical protein ACKOC8_09745 [Pirellulales bacterium]
MPFFPSSFRPHAARACLVALLPFVGCAPPAPPAATPAAATRPATVTDDHDHDHGDDHDHGGDHDHDEPTTFADGVAKLESLAADLAEKLSADEGEAADDAVHGLGHLLEEVRDLAEGEKLDAASKGLDELEECFGKIDEAFHSGEESADPRKVLESVKERLQAAFAELKEVAR